MTQDHEYYYWDRGVVADLSPYFSTSEFECKCSNKDCIKQRTSKVLIAYLSGIRNQLDAPIKITSGFRCAKHQAEIRAQGKETAKGVSQHELGNAADTWMPDLQTLEHALRGYFLAIGVAKSFIHVDTRNDKTRYWTYQHS